MRAREVLETSLFTLKELATNIVKHSSETTNCAITIDSHHDSPDAWVMFEAVNPGPVPPYGVKKTTWGSTVAIGYGLGPTEDPLLGAYIMRKQGWAEAVKKGTSTAKTIKQQYDCHTVYAAGKNPWNLEAHRPTRNNWLVSPKLCNW